MRKLCVLSKDQYIKSGNKHCRKDLEISLTDVTRLQKYVNSNVEWLHGIFGSGSFWGHEDRIRISSSDLGAQAAPLRLLLKELKMEKLTKARFTILENIKKRFYFAYLIKSKEKNLKKKMNLS